MPSDQQALPAPTAIQPAGLWKVWLPIVLFGVLWADMIRQLSYQWDASEQYAYGWFVPFLALALFWKRWTTRPATEPGRSPLFFSILAGLLALSLLPIRLVHEINPDWPLCNWLLALTVVALSLYAIFLAGGIRWLKHFAFPICFILVAVRWPYRIEHGLTQSLMQVVASLTVEILGWFNLPAFQRGNLIELSTGMVGVDEACSGIRSFQSTIMGALFLGELYLLSWPRRALLLVGGVTLAFGFNVVRTLILTWQASTAGLSALDKWHDPAGMAIFLVCFACLWGIAAWLRAKSNPKPETQNPELSSPISPQPLSDSQLSTLTSRPSTTDQLSTLNSQRPLRRYLITIGLWSLCIVGLTELWYRAHERNRPRPMSWAVNLPKDAPSFQIVPVAPAASNMLRSDLSVTGKWQERDGTEWTLFYFRWRPNSMQSVISARLHRPEVCLTGAGLRQTSMSPLDYFPAGPLQIPFHKYTFESGGEQLYVFFSLWQDGEEQGGMRTLDKNDRIKWVREGRRGMGQQTLEIICTGYADMAAAEKAVRQRLPELIQIESHNPPLAVVPVHR